MLVERIVKRIKVKLLDQLRIALNKNSYSLLEHSIYKLTEKQLHGSKKMLFSQCVDLYHREIIGSI